MASLDERTLKSGEISYRVIWWWHGTRQTESGAKGRAGVTTRSGCFAPFSRREETAHGHFNPVRLTHEMRCD
jgi:hypothetical protein